MSDLSFSQRDAWAVSNILVKKTNHAVGSEDRYAYQVGASDAINSRPKAAKGSPGVAGAVAHRAYLAGYAAGAKYVSEQLTRRDANVAKLQRRRDVRAAEIARGDREHKVVQDDTYRAAKNQIWALAEVDEKQGRHVDDPNARLGFIRSDVQTVDGRDGAGASAKLYTKERARVRRDTPAAERSKIAKPKASPKGQLKLYMGREVK